MTKRGWSDQGHAPGLARFTNEKLDLRQVRGGTLVGQDASGSVANPGLILLFSDPALAPDGRPIPGIVPLSDGRRWFVLRNNREPEGPGRHSM